MNFKRAIVTCFIVVLYLMLCTWRFEKLEQIENNNDTLAINVNQ